MERSPQEDEKDLEREITTLTNRLDILKEELDDARSDARIQNQRAEAMIRQLQEVFTPNFSADSYGNVRFNSELLDGLFVHFRNSGTSFEMFVAEHPELQPRRRTAPTFEDHPFEDAFQGRPFNPPPKTEIVQGGGFHPFGIGRKSRRVKAVKRPRR